MKKVKGYEKILVFAVGVNAENSDEADQQAEIIAEAIIKSLTLEIPIRRIK